MRMWCREKQRENKKERCHRERERAVRQRELEIFQCEHRAISRCERCTGPRCVHVREIQRKDRERNSAFEVVEAACRKKIIHREPLDRHIYRLVISCRPSHRQACPPLLLLAGQK